MLKRRLETQHEGYSGGYNAAQGRCPEVIQWLARFGKSANSAHAESVDAAIRRWTLR